MKTTEILVINHLKYSDSSLIFRAYSSDFGMLSFISKGYFKSKKNKNRWLRFPLSAVLEVSLNLGHHFEMKNPRNLQTQTPFLNLVQHPVKSLMLQFLSEILYFCLKEDQANPQLFDFLKTQLAVFNDKERYFADFHLILLIQLSRFLGFFPNQDKMETAAYFDLGNGRFSSSPYESFTLTEYETGLWKRLLSADWSLSSPKQFQQEERRILLDTILKYYQFHLPEFHPPKSIEILRQLM